MAQVSGGWHSESCGKGFLPAGGLRGAWHDAGTMSTGAMDYEKLGQFYLGKTFDPGAGKVEDDLVLYDSKDLVTHGMVVGMTGSGKTGLCMAMLEEAAMDHIPAIVIDPKGDIANLLLMFPELEASSFRPWINEDDAAKKGVTPDEHAENTSAMWRKGLADWGQGPERIKALLEKVDVNVFTPGSRAGIPVSILSSLSAPSEEIIEDRELLGERIVNTTTSLLTLVGVRDEAAETPEAVLVSTIFKKAWEKKQNLTLEDLIRHIQKPAFDKVGVIDLESFMPAKNRQALALKFNTLLASPGFSTWLEGPPLDIARMLHAPDGKPRISIFSIAHLGDTDRMFFVSLLLNQMLGWMRTQKGTTSLRALLYMDEIFGYLPPTANPPSKRPMMTLLKQARAFGLGCLLATQNPVDLDYKALSNIGTWFLGRLQTERDKLRVLDGLEGAAGSQASKFNRKEMERLLSGLGNRVFLMNNVHEDGPVLFHVRWVMSYLTGPMTRGQIKTLMDPKRDAFEQPSRTVAETTVNPMSMPASAAPPATGMARPAVGTGVREIFLPPSASGRETIYQPHLLRTATVHFSLSRAGIDGNRSVRLVNPILANGINWEKTLPPPHLGDHGSGTPVEGASFGELPGFAMNAANYKQVEKEFSDWLYRNERADVFHCPALKAWSEWGEDEGDFRSRLAHQSREARDAAVEKARDAARRKISALENRLRTAEQQLARRKTQATTAKMQAGASLLGGFLKSVMGRKAGAQTITRGTAALGRAGSAYKQHQDVGHAEEKVADVNAEIAAVEADLEAGIEKISTSFDPGSLALETVQLKPTRTDVKVESVGLLWLPYDERGERAW